ncbi:AMP-binding protein [Streptomyces sp. NPDC051677]|uniref:AMP-binding protein n=1 Tax=Streptomyces sp. NPDC051677 TaxID=3365669 RepID=UPI0037CCD724
MIIRSNHPGVNVPETSVTEFLFGELTPEDAPRLAITDAATDRGYTYAELIHAIDRIASALAERGFGHGDVAALVTENCIEYASIFYGVLQSSGVISPANPLYTPSELAYQLHDCGARIVFASSAALNSVRTAVEDGRTSVEEIVVIGPVDGSGSVRETELADFITTMAPSVRARPAAEDLAVLPYSAGTTGLPKGVMITHRNLIAGVLQGHSFAQLDSDSTVLAALPLFHIYGITLIMSQCLHSRGRLVTLPRFDFTRFLEVIERHRINSLFIAPPIAIALVKHPLVDQYDLSSVEFVLCAAAPLDGQLAHALGKRLDVHVLQAYGMTETCPGISGVPLGRTDIDLGSVGVLLPNIEARVVDPETGKDVGAGERGELWCRGPNVMGGYLNNPAASAAALDGDGFLHTGDIVTADSDGVFRVVDRLKELIKYKGYQVAPAELEAVILAHPGINDAAVIGVTDDAGQEVPKAFVQRSATRPDLDADEVINFVAERVAPYKKIRLVEFIDSIPKSPAGKILRRELRGREGE